MSPSHVELVPERLYVPNDMSVLTLLVMMGGAMATLTGVAFGLMRRRQRTVSESARFAWFVVCGALHCGFEVYWLVNHKVIGERTDFLAQLWKEYAHSDARYLTSDPLLFTLEIMTASIWGPLCLLTARSLWQGSPVHYLWQLVASMCHLFSCSLYFIMDWPLGFPNCRPEPVYFWVYFVGFNSPWLVVPGILVLQSWCQISSAFATKSKLE